LQISHHTSAEIALQINGLRVVQGGLKRRGNSRPGKQDTLENTIRAYLIQLGEAPGELPGIMRELQTRAYVSIENKKVTYQLP